MPKVKVKGQMVRPGKYGQTHKWTDGRTDQVYHLPALRSINIYTKDVKYDIFHVRENLVGGRLTLIGTNG